MMKKRIVAGVLAAVAAFGLVGCGSDSSQTLGADSNAAEEQLARYQKNQPVPEYDWSQYRQTLLDIQNAQVHGQATTSFFFNQGVQQPVFSCSSIGFPVPSTAQLTNPEQRVWYQAGGSLVLPQMEQSGVYTGDSTGTYTVCVAPNGTAYVKYWEGFIDTIGGPAHWDSTQDTIVLDGDPTVVSTTE